ncbi:hypothetical protein [Dysgonomonas sp. ZJ709]|uniref:hypothetical protein n=1 Tax=Dysgonomonas sp. ZJ709 TaxID=2709797 RepID=UPI0013ED2145|nr:hypothetical protein [Dysgonomonas sp. ZJ709]
MVKFELGDITMHIPNAWSDIKLADYEQWFNSKPENKMEYIQFVSDICKIDKELLLHSPTQLFDMVANTIDFVFDTDVNPSGKATINGTNYFVTLSDKLTLAEWVDIESTLESDSMTKISEILAIVCRPSGESYDAQTIDRRKELFRNLTCEKVLPLIAFFLRKKQESEAILNHYSVVLAQANQFLKDSKAFVQNGDGIKRLPIWQRIRYTYLTKSLEKQLSKFSDFYSIG